MEQKKRLIRFGIALLISICAISILDAQKAEAAEQKKQTIMFYMIGSDLETNAGAASNDIEEIAAACPDIDQYNLVVYTGGSTAWASNISADRNEIWEYTGENFECAYESDELSNMCDPQTLKGFLDYCSEEYPADSYALVLWDHGGGPLGGYGKDIQFNDASMEIGGIAQALGESEICAGGQKLSWLGFDACLMGSLEVASAMAPYAEYMIASEEVEPSFGWDYNFLGKMTEEGITDGEEAGALIVDEYGAFYEAVAELYPQFASDNTLACQDLSKVGKVTDALEELVVSAQSDLESGDYVMLAQQRLSAKGFGKVGEVSYDMVDVKNLAEEMQEKYALESKELTDAVDEMVVSNYSNVEHAAGLSLYYPSSDLNIAAFAFENYDRLGFSAVYTDYILNYIYQMAQNGKSGIGLTRAAGINLTEEQTVELSYDLTDEQIADFSSAEYVILESYESYMNQNSDSEFNYRDNDHYLIRYRGKNVTVKNGKLAADYTGESFVIVDSEGEKTDLLVEWIGEKSGCDYYEVQAILESYETSDVESEFVEGTLRFYKNQTTGDITVQGFMPDATQKEDGAMISSRGLIRTDRLSDYRQMTISLPIRKPQYYEDGAMKPPSEWKNETDNVLLCTIDNLDESIDIRMEKLDNVKGLYGIFVMKDVWNQVSCSELVEIPDVFKKTRQDEIAADTDCMDMAESVFGMKENIEEEKQVVTDKEGNYLVYDSSEKKHQLTLTPFDHVVEAEGNISMGELYLSTIDEDTIVHQHWTMKERLYDELTVEEIVKARIDDEKKLDKKLDMDSTITDLKKLTLNGQTYYWYAVLMPRGSNDTKYIEYNILSEVAKNIDLEVWIKEETYSDASQEYLQTGVKDYLNHVKEVR